MESRSTRIVLGLWVIGVLLFLFIPIVTIILYAFDRSNVQAWPIKHYTTLFRSFSLTLGDYITPVLVGGASSQFIGNVVYDSVNQASNLPFGAAFAVVPVVVMGDRKSTRLNSSH